MINKGVLHTVATWFPRNNAIICQWAWGEWANTTMIAFTGVTRLNSCVRTHCFHLFDICRVEFIWGNITFLSYIDGSVQERCTVLLIKVLPSLPVTAQRGSAPSAPYPPERATSGIATCSAVGDTYRPVSKLSPALGWWTLPCLACLWARIRARPAKQSAGWRNTVTNV